MQNWICWLIKYLRGNAILHLQLLSNSSNMKRSFSKRDKLVSSDPDTIMQLMDELSSDDDSRSEFDGYITDDEDVYSSNCSTRFFQNETSVTSEEADSVVERLLHITSLGEDPPVQTHQTSSSLTNVDIPSPPLLPPPIFLNNNPASTETPCSSSSDPATASSTYNASTTSKAKSNNYHVIGVSKSEPHSGKQSSPIQSVCPSYVTPIYAYYGR